MIITKIIPNNIENTMNIQLGDIAPDFTQNSTIGEINFHEWLGVILGSSFSTTLGYVPE